LSAQTVCNIKNKCQLSINLAGINKKWGKIMKLITFAIPCYNSAAYMEKCINSLLVGGTDIEIIIVDDGSTKDNTLEIARKYEKEYPDIVRAIHQENGGHGEAVNTGLRNATGRFYKVVDSDDWVDEKSLKKVIKTLKSFEEDNEPDMVIANYVYEKVGVTKKRVIHYRNVFPIEKMFTWDEMLAKFKVDQYILMHSVIYKTEVLRKCSLELPKHTFYVDNIFVFEPLPCVNKMYYIDTNFYRYFIGREDQSVNEKVMISRIDQQLRVTKRMIESYLSIEHNNEKCRYYMRNYLRIMMEISSIFLIISGTKEDLAKKKELWQFVKNKDKNLYKELRFCALGWSVNIPGGPLGRGISKIGYKVMNKLIGFN
jgi:glycosyltransferase involved in cell wall biosynthesis